MFFTISVVLYGIENGVHGLAAGDLTPSTHGLIAVVPVLIYSFVGVELPSTAAEEMVTRAATSLWRSVGPAWARH